MSTATATARRTRAPKVQSVPPPAPEVPLAPVSRSIRTVTVSLNVVSFSANLHGAVVEQKDDLETVCTNNHEATKIQRPDKCPACSTTDRTNFTKARIVGDSVTVLKPEQVESLKAANNEVGGSLDLKVVQADDSYMRPTGSTYYLAPRGAGDVRNYTLISTIIRERPQLAFLAELSFLGGAPKLLRLSLADDGVLTAREIARPEAVRARPQVATPTADATLMPVIRQLVDAAAVPFDPAAFANPHLARVSALLSEAQPVTATPTSATSPTTGDALDILAALKASVAQLKGPPAAKPATRRARKTAA